MAAGHVVATKSICLVTCPRPPSLISVPALRSGNKTQQRRLTRSTPSHICRSWQEAVSETGQTYYWNTVTRETSWDCPAAADQVTEPSVGPISVPSATETASNYPSNQEMLQRLGAALEADASGMQFAEEARSLRGSGVFEDAYFDFLTNTVDSGSTKADRTMAEKLRARLCNPLLRQAAPYE